MGSLPPELSLDFRPTFVPKTIGAFLKEVSTIGDFSEKGSRVGDFVKRLEEEMGKIDAFKRELPLCMLLLNDAILALKDELLQLTPPKAQPEPVLEEFIPMKKESENEGSKKESERRDKKNWMSTFQLYDYQSVDPPKHEEIKRKEEESSNTASEVDEFQIQNHEKSNGGGKAFLPFCDFPVAVLRKEEREELPVPGLSLLMPGIKSLREESGSSGSKTCYSRPAHVQTSLGAGPSQSQSARKQRRCWSPELHRRFVSALQELGGSQVATPKQIREHMQVDGLTNDEVKSHLQKYRLHTRRANGATASTSASQSVVVLGNLWTPQDHCSQSSKTNSSQSGSPQGPFQLGTHDSTTGGDSMDDDEEEEEKSESYNWKNHLHKPIKSDA